MADLTTGPDDKLWATATSGYLVVLDPSAGSDAAIQASLTQFDIPTNGQAGARYAGAITTGADGNLWFVEGRETLRRVSDIGDFSNAVPVPPPPPVCPATPQSGCRAPVVSDRGILDLREATPDTGDLITWKWRKGAAAAKADFGDPINDDTYELCIYDGTSTLISNATAPVGGTCNSPAGMPLPCWTETTNGFEYTDADATPDGIKRIVLRQGLTPGTAKITVNARGVDVAIPSAFPLAQPVTVQLLKNTGVCWEAIYDAPAILNALGPPGRFRDRAN